MIPFCDVMFKISHDFHSHIPLPDKLPLALQVMQSPMKMLVCQRLFILMQSTWHALPFLFLSSASVSHFVDFSCDTDEKTLVITGTKHPQGTAYNALSIREMSEVLR